MILRSLARVVPLVAAVALAAGCGGGDGGDASSTPALQLRLVISSSDGACSEPPLTSDGAGSACSISGETSYELGESLGKVTPTNATLTDDRGAGQGVALEFDEADIATLNDVTGDAVIEELALLLDGRVISAARVVDPIAGGQLLLAMATPADAEQVVATLRAATS